MNVTLTNCGAVSLVVREGPRCGGEETLALALEGRRGHYEWHGGVPADLGLRGGPMCLEPSPVRFVVPPGESYTETRSWNGTVARSRVCEIFASSGMMGRSICAREERLGDEYALRASYRNASAGARIVVEAPPPSTLHLVLVREWAWKNHSSFLPTGPHCAEAELRGDELSVFADVPHETHALLRERRAPAAAADYDPWPPTGGSLVSPYDPELYLAEIVAVGSEVYLNGTLLARNETRTLRVDSEGAAHVLEVTNVGPVRLRLDLRGCD